MDPLTNAAQVTSGFVAVSAIILGLRTIASFALSVHEQKAANAEERGEVLVPSKTELPG